MRGLYDIKPRFVASLRDLEDALVARGVSADALTYASLPVAALCGAALAAGYLVHPALWALVGPLALLRMALNALDGAVARRTGTSHLRGAAANELVDRAGDALTLLPAALAIDPWLAIAATAGAWGVAFVAVLAQALTGTRLSGGPMGKPDRALTVSIGAAAAVAVGPVALVVAFAIVVVGAAVTIALRIRRLGMLARETETRALETAEAEHARA